MNLIGALLLSSCLMLGSITEDDRIKKLKKIRAALYKMAREKRIDYPEINTLILQAQEHLEELKKEPHYWYASSQALFELEMARLLAIELKPEGLRDSRFFLHRFLLVTREKRG